MTWTRFTLVLGVLLLVFVAIFASFGGALGAREQIAAAVARITVSGAPALLYLLGAILMAYNVTMTILGYERDEAPIGGADRTRSPALQPAE